jgi:hypothetical protein
MIYAIEFEAIHGKQGRTGVNAMPEHTDQSQPKYAHSLEQAMAWVKTNVPFADVEAQSLHDGRYIYQTDWQELDQNNAFLHLFGPEGATHMMKEIIIYPVDTVFESFTPREPAVYSLE